MSGYKFEGARYEATKSLSLAAVNRLIRADIKVLVEAGEIPSGAYTVRKGHRTITIEFIAPLRSLFAEKRLVAEQRDPHGWHRGERYSAEARALVATLTAVASAYTYDDSDICTDYFNSRFWLYVKPEPEWERTRRELEIERVEFTRRERESGHVAMLAAMGVDP